MATTIKMTDMEKFTALMALVTDEIPNADILREFCEKKMNQLIAKKHRSAEKSGSTEVNKAVAAEVSAILGQAGRPMTATEIFKASTANSVQRITHVLRDMLATGEVLNDREGKTSLYYLPVEDADADADEVTAEE